tara:strand:+ start:534 stop:821 length:288 start_codon:yes stop_codon:yes gene_type:complete
MIQEPNNIDAIVALRPGSEFNFNLNGLDWLDEKTTKPTDEEIATKLAELKAATQYKINRAKEYPSIEDQLDTIYHSGVAGWKTTIKAIKDKYPKP